MVVPHRVLEEKSKRKRRSDKVRESAGWRWKVVARAGGGGMRRGSSHLLSTGLGCTGSGAQSADFN